MARRVPVRVRRARTARAGAYGVCMRVHVVSDVHGRADALPAAADGRGRADLPG